MEGEGIFNSNLSTQVVLGIMNYLSNKNIEGMLNIEEFVLLASMLANSLAEANSELTNDTINGFIFIVYLLKTTLVKKFNGIIAELLQK